MTRDCVHGSLARSCQICDLQDQINELEAVNQQLLEALKSVTVHLIAAHSLLRHGGKKAAASDKIFTIMLNDYEKSFEVGRAAIAAAEAARTTGGQP